MEKLTSAATKLDRKVRTALVLITASIPASFTWRARLLIR